MLGLKVSDLEFHSFFVELRRHLIQPPHVKNFINGQRFDLRLPQRDDGDGLSDGVKNFQRVAWLLAWPAGMVFHNRGDVAGLEFVLGDLGPQRHSAKQLVFHKSIFCRIQRDKLVNPVAWFGHPNAGHAERSAIRSGQHATNPKFLSVFGGLNKLGVKWQNLFSKIVGEPISLFYRVSCRTRN